MPPLELTEDVVGERLVLVARCDSVGYALREMIGSSLRSLSSFAREIRQRPRTPRELFVSAGMVLLAGVLCALVLLACIMVVVGAALVVVLYAIGAWLIAWWLVRETARYLLHARLPSRERDGLSLLSFAREPAQLSWRDGGRTGVRAFASLSSLRVSVRSRLGAASEITLLLPAHGESEALRLLFSVARIDREEEAFDLCMRIARVLGWNAFAMARDHLHGLEVELRPAGPADRAHHFRSYVAAPRFHPVEAADRTTTDWDVRVAPGFREPSEPVPPLAPELASKHPQLMTWLPGRMVELRAERSAGLARVVGAQAGATLVAYALPLSVVLMISAIARRSLLETEQDSLVAVMWLLTKWSAIAGWFLALGLVLRRTRQEGAVLNWNTRQLTIRDAQGLHPIAFSEIVALVLTETADRRYAVSVTFESRPSHLLIESEPSSAAHAAYLSLTVELARSLGVAWRCVSDVP